MFTIGMLFLVSTFNLSAQVLSPKITHKISALNPTTTTLQATGTLDVVAIMVEFQPDTNRLTSGNGTFEDGGLPYLENAPDIRIDPLPHNKSYFEAHLEFAKNYYEKSSDGKLTLNYRVLPQVYRLDKKIEEYSPIGETFTYEKLALLLKDAWQKVEEGGGFDATGLDPEKTAFVIFHAGVGRDIELTGTSLDITPYDIPSIYLRKDNLKELLEDPSFDGFPINNGTFRITNSLIMPRTESRRGEDVQENEIVFSLSINGLLCASIGSHLGLPDLFNTETGDPAIGRFGLMDGASFFSYNGLFPPEPSAWEKVYLGWETPFTIHDNTAGEIPLPATSLNMPNSIAKYELSASEYFLIENRHRDPENDGVTLTTRKPDGSEVRQIFTNSDEAFVYQESDFDTLLEKGVIINVDNFDWSLPGGLDYGPDNKKNTDDDRILNGGILIWQVDESVINEQLQAGLVNADYRRRGVDLEEADGSQDIGRGLDDIDNSASFGYAYDFWWSGNNYRVISQTGTEILYQNRFGPTTTPNNNSNSGAESYFELYDFSDNLPTASFKIKSADNAESNTSLIFSQNLGSEEFFTPNDTYWNMFPLSLSVYETASDTFAVIPGNDRVLAVNTADSIVYTLNSRAVQLPFIGPKIVLSDNPSISSSGKINVDAYSWNALTHAFINDWNIEMESHSGFLSSQNGDTLFADFSPTKEAVITQSGTVVTVPEIPEFRSQAVNGSYSSITGSSVTFHNTVISDYISSASKNRLYSGIIKTGNAIKFYIFEDDAFIYVDPEKENPFTVIFSEETAEWPAFADNGFIYHINKQQNTLEGFNPNGGRIDFTPITPPTGVQFMGTPLIADVTGDQQADLIVTGRDDYSLNLYAYQFDGTSISGFPLYVGGAVDKNAQPIHPIIYQNKILAVGPKGDFKIWDMPNLTSIIWGSRYGNNPFNKVSVIVSGNSTETPAFSVLNKDETYNWPNPADAETYIRFQVETPGGSVEIKVINLAGRTVFEKTIQTDGGYPEEVLISTRGWGSGAYYALVKATVNGKSESELIKIGVAH